MPSLLLDLGCTKHIAAVADDDGALIGQPVRAATPNDRDAEAGVAAIVDTIARAAAAAGVSVDDADLLAVGAPGPLDIVTGVVDHPPHLPHWGRFPLADRLREELAVDRVVIDNDCTAGGFGEYRFGAGAGSDTMVYFGVGTGIGGSIVVDGRLHHGASLNAAELGHMVVQHDGGPTCVCGNQGCLGAYAAGTGIERRAAELVASGGAPDFVAAIGHDGHVSAAEVVALAADGQPDAARIWGEAQHALGTAVGVMMTVLSPDVVVLGGGIAAKHGEALRSTVERIAREVAFGANAAATRIELASLGDFSVVHGARAMAIDARADARSQGAHA